MAATPDFKVYDSEGGYQGCCKDPEAAAMIAEHYQGSVRYGHGVKETLWKTGDTSPTGESFDKCRNLMFDRLLAIRQVWAEKRAEKRGTV
jgi:hypothetical protein